MEKTYTESELQALLKDVENVHPYKQKGNIDSYGAYSEGWSDACEELNDKILSHLKEKENDLVVNEPERGITIVSSKVAKEGIEKARAEFIIEVDDVTIDKATSTVPCVTPLYGSKSIEQVVEQFHEWQVETFKNATPISKLKHLEQEVIELIIELTDSADEEKIKSEYADCFALLFGSARARGYTMQDIADFLLAKLEVNKRRKWGKPDENGVVNHIKSDAPLPTVEQSVQECDASKATSTGEPLAPNTTEGKVTE